MKHARWPLCELKCIERLHVLLVQEVQHQQQVTQTLQLLVPPTQHPYPILGLPQALAAMLALHLQVWYLFVHPS